MNKNTISNADIIRAVAKKTDFRQVDVREVMLGIEEVASEIAAQATEDTEVSAKILPHLVFTSKFVDEHETRLPTGEVVMSAPKYRATAKPVGTLKEVAIS